MNGQPHSRRLGYGVAVLATAASLVLRWPLWPLLGNAVPHMTFFPAVMAAAYVGGFRPGLLATVLSATATSYFLTDILPTFRPSTVNDGVALAIFLLVGVIISALCESLHRTRYRLVAEERRRSGEALREEQLRHEKEVAEAANRAKGAFLANVSHEIRTPMNAILGMTELALDTSLTGDQRRTLMTVKTAADHLLGIIDDLLDFSKIEAGKLELDCTEFSPRNVAADTLSILAVRSAKKGLKLAVDVDPEVPDVLIGDAGRLRQVLFNLVGNAIKFTDQGKVELRATVAGTAAGDHVTLRIGVTDTGVGIPSDQHERIFRAFEQGDASTTRRYGGTGLGLTIAARLVRLMGGTIRVDSRPGHGSTFVFTARFGRAPSDRLETADQRAATHDHATDGAGDPLPDPSEARALTSTEAPLRILVADDNLFNTVLLEQLLTRRGHLVHSAANGREAVSLSETDAFDLLLLDLHMPVLDGFGVIREIRERERATGTRLLVVALTARSRPEDRERCLAAGMDDFLSKPIRPANLWAAIERAVRSRPAERLGGDLIDPLVLLAACDGDPGLLTRISAALRAHLPAHLLAVQEAVRNGDAPALRSAAHRICGMVSVFSKAVAELASELEDCATAGLLNEARPLVERLASFAQELMRQASDVSVERLHCRL